MIETGRLHESTVFGLECRHCPQAAAHHYGNAAIRSRRVEVGPRERLTDRTFGQGVAPIEILAQWRFDHACPFGT